jgi:DNA helicase-2/ATP-dependent DNA helicase PcrA
MLITKRVEFSASHVCRNPALSDRENEALFVADRIAKYLKEAVEHGETPRAAVLYRTNSQSRLYEEAMRRYGLKYHVVGGFSFYERAEIKDMISYLKVIHNPDDSISLLRVINTPVRGIGKTSIETLERVALETGLSLWGAIAEVIKRAPKMKKKDVVIVNVSGRGDKDIGIMRENLEIG